MTGHCAGPIKFARGLAGSRALRRSSRLGLRACITEAYERLQSAVLNAEIQAEERLTHLLARLQRGGRRGGRRSTGRPRKEFWT